MSAKLNQVGGKSSLEGLQREKGEVRGKEFLQEEAGQEGMYREGNEGRLERGSCGSKTGARRSKEW